MSQIRVLIVEDHERVRSALLAKLASDQELLVAAAEASTDGALEAALDFGPDVILLDVKPSDGSGMEICRRIVRMRPGVRVLILTSYADEGEKAESQALGAAGYLLKDLDLQELLQQIKGPRGSATCTGNLSSLACDRQAAGRKEQEER